MFNEEKRDSPHEQRPSDRPQLLRQLEARSLQQEASDASDAQGEQYFLEVFPCRLLAPPEDKLMHPFGKEGKHCNDSPALNHDIEKVGLAWQPIFGDKQVRRRRDRQKFSDSLNNPENGNIDPMAHLMVIPQFLNLLTRQLSFLRLEMKPRMIISYVLSG
jgi:hypothetical protein